MSFKTEVITNELKVSENDALPQFLVDKLVAGSGVSLAELNDGGTESIEITASGAAALPDFTLTDGLGHVWTDDLCPVVLT